MPTIPSIRTSIENQSVLIRDPHAKNGQFLRDAKGRLRSYSGGFTVVYPYTSNGEKWAFRCWHAELGNVRKRFDVVSKAIQRAKSPYLCDFVYTDEGIVVDGKIYPTTRMRWVEGVTIKDYICKHKNSKSKLLALADNFLALTTDMHRNKFAHGDLQHGNIIVNDNGELFLVDYDSFYCPSLKGEPEIITGLKDYQHPARRNNLIVSEKLDYFSELIIYLSILAIAHNPALVDKYQVKDSERMLFSADDFSNIKYSDIYKDILALGQEFVVYLQILEIYLSKTSLSDLEPFDILLERLTKDPVIKKFSVSCGKKTLNGKSIVLSWDVENYTQILLDGKDVTTQISNTLTINSSTTYTLTVINGHKRTTKSIMVSSYSSPSVAVTASKTKLHKGRNESVTINWGVQNAEKITLLQDGVPIDKKCGHDDSYKCSIKDTTTFTVQALALDGNTTFSDSVTVEVHPDAKCKFESDKEYAFPKIPFTLSWTTKHAKRVELNGKKVADNGTEIIKKGVDKDTTYTLAVTDEFGTKESSITIKMLPVPRINALLVPTPDIQQTITMNVDLKLPNITVSSLDTQLQEVELIGASLYNTELEAIETPQFIDLQYKLKTPTLWQKIEKSIAKLLHRNENR